MRKAISALVAIMMTFAVFLPQQAQAASVIRIYIDGALLQTDQNPVIVNGRTLVPLRGIFEALNASVMWDQKTQTVTAFKRGTTVSLTIGDRTATIDQQTTQLDTPAQIINGRTVVPVRFVSEALGEEVTWDPKTQTVIIATSLDEVAAVSNVSVALENLYSDGRDMKISFAPPSDQTDVRHYRIMVVKAEKASSFDLTKAKKVRSSNYTTVSVNNASRSTALSSQSKDVDGELIRANQAYRVFVMTVGSESYALSKSSASIVITGSPAAGAATQVTMSDVSDYGDGRDVLVSFAKAQPDANVSGYRVMIVKSKDASKFTLAVANAVTSDYYVTVSKGNSSTLSAMFGSAARDVSGELIKNGETYTAFVLSLSQNAVASLNRLSAPSNSVTLANAVSVPVITSVADVGNHGDGRDLRVSFKKAADESRISGYRMFVVRSADAGSFTLAEAAKVSSGRHYDVSKTGSDMNVTLPSGMRDVKGNAVTNGVSYRVFAMGVANAPMYSNALSAPSSAITLSSANTVEAATSISVSDVGDANNGQDLRVSFRKASGENNINHYRIFVVKDANANSFHLGTANAITDPSYYTIAYKTGGDLSLQLLTGARDVNGALIQNGVKYRVFVMSVGDGIYWGTNALSSASAAITLTNNSVSPATNVTVNDVNDTGTGQDLRVSFVKAADESRVQHYRIFVVRSGNAGSFTLPTANAISNPELFTVVFKTGGDLSQALSSQARDVNGAYIQNGVSYRVFVLSVGGGSYNGTNALSSASPEITLSNQTAVAAVKNVKAVVKGTNGDPSDIEVSFSMSETEYAVRDYRAIVVPAAAADTYTLADANRAVSNGNYVLIQKLGRDISQRLTATLKDSDGQAIRSGDRYRVFVLATANGNASPALSSPSDDIVSIGQRTVPAPEVQNVAAEQGAGPMNLIVSFTNSNEVGVAHYAVLLVRDSDGGLTESMANGFYSAGNYTRVDRTARSAVLTGASVDVNGAPLAYNTPYKVYVLTIADGAAATVNKLAASAASVTLREI
ncbi:copper amine oxidase N-terminal domain-containing protein [Paenibacillus antri]|uniref:copper amine oxidase N-terminal domain-containing protein n=1 Tax=Paenibacillus antri TaxID=2582848 RepID=UPI00130538E6|nr:copper amine oxidase N-terminal domain-containing protein [Paenibacillus antri]